MGVILGSKTIMECNGARCKVQGNQPDYDQHKAVEIAIRAGWYKNQQTGETFCPKCKSGQYRFQDLKHTPVKKMDWTMHNGSHETQYIVVGID